MKINSLNMTLTLFNGENKIYKWVKDDRTSANLKLMTNYSQKKGDEWANYSMPVVIWGKPEAIERIEAKLYNSLNSAQNNGGVQKIDIAIMNGTLSGDIREMTDPKSGKTYGITTPQINVNLSAFSTIAINPDFESPFEQEGARGIQSAGQSGTYANQPAPQQFQQPVPQQNQGFNQPMPQPAPQPVFTPDVNLEEIKF